MSNEESAVKAQSKEPDDWRAAHELYKQVYGEIVRYRDMEWKISVWTILLLGATTGIRYPNAGVENCWYYLIRGFVVAYVLFVALFGSWHLHFAHRELTHNRNLRRKIEYQLGFFDPTRNGGVSLLPSGWAKRDVLYSQGLLHLISWWIVIAAVAIYAITIAVSRNQGG